APSWITLLPTPASAGKLPKLKESSPEKNISCYSGGEEYTSLQSCAGQCDVAIVMNPSHPLLLCWPSPALCQSDDRPYQRSRIEILSIPVYLLFEECAQAGAK